MDRITDKQLDAVAEMLNRATKSPLESWAPDAKGKQRAQIGNHHISHSYGGVCLQRMSNEAGGVTYPIGMGHVPKRELFERMHAYLAGLREHETQA